MSNLDDTKPSIKVRTPTPAAPDAETQPAIPLVQPKPANDPLSDFQPIRRSPPPVTAQPGKKTSPRRGPGCWLPLLLLVAVLATYFIFPIRTNIVLLGIDARQPGETLGRSDTMILLTLKPVGRYTGMLSIPRDLWVSIPGVGENRINTAHFFAEAAQNGSGPEAVKAVIQANFGVEVHYFVRARFDNFIQMIDMLGGVRITLDEKFGDYPAGTHLLDSAQALAFVRDRTTGGDDFGRMHQAQILVRGLIETALLPANISKWPEMSNMLSSTVETDIPVYLWPRLAAAVLFSMQDGFDGRVIGRDLVTPFTTAEGAQVLGPRWELIQPVVQEMFGASVTPR